MIPPSGKSAHAVRAWFRARALVRHPAVFPVLLPVAAALLLALALAFRPADGSRWKAGEVAPIKVKSPVDFEVEDAAATHALREEARLKTPLLFEHAGIGAEEARAAVSGFLDEVRRVLFLEDLRPESRLARLKELTGVAWTREQLEEARRLNWPVFEEVLLSEVGAAWSRRIVLEDPPGSTGPELPAREIVVRSPSGETLLSGRREELSGRVVTTRQFVNGLVEKLGRRFASATFVREFLRRGVGDRLPPTARYLVEATRLREKAAVSSVVPVRITVRKNEKIVEDGEVLTDEHLLKLAGLRQATGGLGFLPVAGLLLLAFALASAYLARFQRGLLARRRHVTLFYTLVGGALLAGRALSALQDAWPGVEYAYPLPTAPLLTAMLLSPGAALASAMLTALGAGVLTGFQAAPVFTALFSGITAVLAAGRVRTRNDFLRAGLWISVTAAATAALFHAAGYGTGPLAPALLGAGLNGVFLCAMLALVSLAWVENAFGVVSDVRLLELSDFNHPLLKRMQLEAPGTYHHSLLVGHLAEAAASAVGANPLLARVGAYFHDLGKSSKSEYFGENQGGGPGRHRGLSPYMSAMVIQNHVKEGIAEARKAGLPQAIVDFIPQHQGTTLIRAFYHKAQEEAGGTPVDEQKFRYPGPKPQNRETAIVMLADSVESAARSLKEPSHQRFEDVVHRVLSQKTSEGQLEECDLTLKDLRRIADSFVRTLDAVYHSRPAYPSEREGREPNVMRLFGVAGDAPSPAGDSRRARGG